MPKFNPDNLNIHELAVEEPEKDSELVFDPERDITEEEWMGIRDHFNDVKKFENINTKWKHFIAAAIPIKILKPDYDLEITEKEFEELKQYFQQARDGGMHDDFFIDVALFMKLIGKEISFTPAEKRRLSGTTEIIKDDMVITNGLQMLKSKILVPESDIEDEEKEILLKEIENYQKLPNRVGMLIADPIFLSALARIFVPEFESKFTKNDLNMAKEAFKNSSPNPNIYDATKSYCLQNFAMCMRILVAEKVKITENGLELTILKKKEGLQPENSQLPEKKQF